MARTDPLTAFSPLTASWFAGAFAAPTPVQIQAWDVIRTGQHALVVAPTGAGKTLAAFLAALDRLITSPVPSDSKRRCRVLYVSPMKALAVDVQRNLRAPLAGLTGAATRLGLPMPDVSVGIRTGDTPADDRRRMARTPPDILITTPESLFLLLTSSAREALLGVESVILDEVHAIAGNKRGAHLAVSLERLDVLLDKARAAHRVVRHGPAGGRGGPVPWWRTTRDDRCAAVREVGRDRDPGARRRHDGPGRAGRSRPGRARPAPAPPLDLARGRTPDSRPRNQPFLDARLHQLAGQRRTAVQPPQRVGRRERGRRAAPARYPRRDRGKERHRSGRAD